MSFYRDVEAALKSQNLKAIAVLTALPQWVKASPNKEALYVDKFIKVVANTFKGSNSIIGYQIWNEPNDASNDDNGILGFSDPQKYFELVQKAAPAIKAISPNKLVLNASTTSIIQNYRDTISYNEKLMSLGIESYIDKYAFHYYGDPYTTLLRPYGALEFLKSVSIPLWVTEVGTPHFDKHSSYAKIKIPYLLSRLGNLERVFWYQFDGGPGDKEYNITNGVDTSTLYQYLLTK